MKIDTRGSWPRVSVTPAKPFTQGADAVTNSKRSSADLEAGQQSKAAKPQKPAKPYEGFPLFPHDTKRWAKKIRGKLYYFGPWADPEAALQKYLDQRDDLFAGRTPRATQDDRLTLRDVCNAFLDFKDHKVECGELTSRSFADLKRATDTLIAVLGRNMVVDEIRPDDLLRVRERIVKGRKSPKTMGDEIARCRMVFNFAFDEGLTDKKVRFGQSFRRPSKAVVRRYRAAQDMEHGKRFFDAAEIKQLLDVAGLPMRAMILLGINCGFGNSDVAKLTFPAVNLDGGEIHYPRPKTGIDRRCPIWPETVDALREAIDKRPAPKHEGHASLVFVTKYGQAWFKESGTANPISAEFNKLLKETELQRKRRGFYALRHTFETIGGESRDQVAVNHIMGHVDDTMAAEYRETISEGRLLAVVNEVRSWLFADSSPAAETGGKAILPFPNAG